jgi:hypothetical protein
MNYQLERGGVTMNYQLERHGRQRHELSRNAAA